MFSSCSNTSCRPGKIQKFDDLDVFLGPDFLITVHAQSASTEQSLPTGATECGEASRPDPISIVDLIVDEYLSLLDKFAEDISRVEDKCWTGLSRRCWLKFFI